MNYTQKPINITEINPIVSQQKAYISSFNSLLPELQEDSKIIKARAILREVAADMSDEELSVYLTQFEYLLDDWLDTFEKSIFNNKTLQELLRER